MGYTTMTEEEFAANAAAWEADRAAGRTPSRRISKNQVARTHACLIPWEELDALSARESALTGRAVDYKQTDINNVLALPRLLGERKTEAEP